MIFNYIPHDFEGTLIEDGREGKPEWVRIADISDIDMQENFKRRIHLFFEEGTFETHMNRYQEGMKEEHVIKM